MSRPGPVARLLVALVGVYRRFVSPLLGPHCRFAPSCSAYAVDALDDLDNGRVRGRGILVPEAAAA